MLKRFWQIIIVLALMAPVTSYAQEADKFNRNPEKRQQELEKNKEKKKKESDKIYEAEKKAHYKMQTKDVRKRMKKTAKRSARHNNNRGKFSFKRLFKGRR